MSTPQDTHELGSVEYRNGRLHAFNFKDLPDGKYNLNAVLIPAQETKQGELNDSITTAAEPGATSSS